MVLSLDPDLEYGKDGRVDGEDDAEWKDFVLVADY